MLNFIGRVVFFSLSSIILSKISAVPVTRVQYVLFFFTIFINDIVGPLATKLYAELHNNSSQYLDISNYLVFNWDR
jgi:hypothetical protein